jgi:hypothetical protein
MPTVTIAGDEPDMREMLREQFSLPWPDLDIVADPGDGPPALVQIERLRRSLPSCQAATQTTATWIWAKAYRALDERWRKLARRVR